MVLFNSILSILSFSLASIALYYFLKTGFLVSERLLKVYIYFTIPNILIIFLSIVNIFIYFELIGDISPLKLETNNVLLLRDTSLFIAALFYLIAFRKLYSICLETYERKNKIIQEESKFKESLKKEIYRRIKEKLKIGD